MPLYSGPTEQVKQITDNLEEFKSTFETPSEFIQKKEGFINTLAKNEVISDVEAAIRKDVDEIIEMEIRNKRTIWLKGKKDQKMPKNFTRGGNKPPAEKLGPGEKPLVKIDIKELFSDGVMNGVIRKMVPKNLNDLISDFNYIAQNMQLVDEQINDVPFFYTKQLIKELCIYPLGCQLVKSHGKLTCNSILFFGPPGTGKTHAALAVACHTDALFIDLSPRNLEGRFNTREELNKIVATAFRVAKNFQPAVIYFDNAEQIFVNTRAKGAVKNPQATRLKKILLSYKNLVTPDMRILFIGNTNKGWHMSNKDFKAMFDKNLYFSLPAFSDRYKIWKKYITDKIGRSYELEYDILAQMSSNFSAESIRACIDYTLSKDRLDKIKFTPLQSNEFISALSKTQYLYKDDFIKNRVLKYI